MRREEGGLVLETASRRIGITTSGAATEIAIPDEEDGRIRFTIAAITLIAIPIHSTTATTPTSSLASLNVRSQCPEASSSCTPRPRTISAATKSLREDVTARILACDCVSLSWLAARDPRGRPISLFDAGSPARGRDRPGSSHETPVRRYPSEILASSAIPSVMVQRQSEKRGKRQAQPENAAGG